MNLDRFFASATATTLDVGALTEALNKMSHEERTDAVLALTAKQQAVLFDAVKDRMVLRVQDMVADGKTLSHPVIHHGKNSLLLFTTFQKRFCRPGPDNGATEPEELWGYNEQVMKPVTGPGYFLAHNYGDNEVVIDYTAVPPTNAKLPSGWPKILPNSAKLSRFIYNGTKDYLRRVSEHVTIGRAARAGKDMDNWFVLVRQD